MIKAGHPTTKIIKSNNELISIRYAQLLIPLLYNKLLSSTKHNTIVGKHENYSLLPVTLKASPVWIVITSGSKHMRPNVWNQHKYYFGMGLHARKIYV